MLLSIAMIVKNEEKNISRCLKAIKGLENKIEYEIVVVDTGSRDKTVEIAKKFTDKVYEHSWSGDFSEMRNISISYCKGKWILILDADEVIESTDEIVDFFKGNDSEIYNCVTLKSKNIISKNKDDYIIMNLVRLFRNTEGFHYTGIVHEQPTLLEPVGVTNICFLHYGYSREDYKVMQYKYERNIGLLLRDIEKGNNSVYVYFQLAQTYSMANKNREAFKAINEAFDLVKKSGNDIKYIYVYHLYSMLELNANNYEKCIKLSKEALKYNKDHLDFYYMIAKSYFSLNKYEEGNKYFDKYFKLYAKIRAGYIVQDISVCNNSFSKYEEAIKYCILCKYNVKEYDDIPVLYKKIEKEKYKEELKEIYIYILIREKKYKEIFNYYKDKEIKDEDIQTIINGLDKHIEDAIVYDIRKETENMLSLDYRLDLYINKIYLNNISIKENEKINLGQFYKWKADYIIIDLKESDFLLKLSELKIEDIKKYLLYLTKDYKWISVLYEFYKDKYIDLNLDTLHLVNIVGDILLFNNSINNDEFNELVSRISIGKLNYIRNIYNKQILDSNIVFKILNRTELIWVELYNLKKEPEKLNYIKKLRELLKKFPEYNKVIAFYLENANYTINEKMMKEKDDLLNIVENYISEMKLDEALEILKELNNVFKYDYSILNLLGVALYMKKDYDKSLLNLALANNLEENFDNAYNLACVLESKHKINEAKHYYNVAYNLSEDIDIKNEILNIIKQLDKN